MARSLDAKNYELPSGTPASQVVAEYDRLEAKLKADLFSHYKIHGPIAEMVWEKARQDYSAEVFGNSGIITAFDDLMELVNLTIAHGAVL